MSARTFHFGAIKLDELRIYVVDPVDAKIRDISQGGMALYSEVPLALHKSYRFKIQAGLSSVALDADVVRCTLQNLEEDLEGHTHPLYVNAVRFMIQRNPLEISLLEILAHNIGDERRSTPRMKPKEELMVEIAHPMVDTVVRKLDDEGIDLWGEEVPDMEDNITVLLQAGYETLLLPVRLIHVSKKDGEKNFTSRLEFGALDDLQRRMITDLAACLAEG